MENTKIRCAENTWNPMTGCTKISPGCDNGYAETIAEKFRDDFKQSAAPRTEMGQLLDGQRHEEYPLPHPTEHATLNV